MLDSKEPAMNKRFRGLDADARHGDSAPSVGRRRFLLHAATACGAIAGFARGARAAPPLAGSADPSLAIDGSAAAGPRSLRFVHTHTGESLTTAYFDGSAYDAASLGDVNHLLRDFRTGESHRMDPQLLDILYDLQVLADREATFEVICGYRSPATNAMLHRLSSGVAE